MNPQSLELSKAHSLILTCPDQQHRMARMWSNGSVSLGLMEKICWKHVWRKFMKTLVVITVEQPTLLRVSVGSCCVSGCSCLLQAHPLQNEQCLLPSASLVMLRAGEKMQIYKVILYAFLA